MTEADEVASRTASSEEEARDWMLVLSAAGVPCRVDRRPDGWAVVVSSPDASRAAAALVAYDADAVPVSAATTFEWGPTRAGLVIAALLVAFRPLTGYRVGAGPAFMAGEGSAAAIVGGQAWRTVTALTLHADPTHLL
ncbi:MAG: hypothetical protein ACREQL_10600, partial [Candidatus Binatia bacterium]